MAATVANGMRTIGVTQKTFGTLPPAVIQAMDSVSMSNAYPTGTVLFAEGQTPRGMYWVKQGQIKLSVCARDGKTLILRIAEAGEILGLAAAVGNRQYEATAEIQQPAEISFIRQSDVLRLMRMYGEFALWVTQQVAEDYNTTCREIRTLMFAESASEKLARLLVGWLNHHEQPGHAGQMKLPLTHEEIGQMIGTSRETVTRLLAGFRKQHFIEQRGATVVVSNRVGLESLLTV